MLRSLDGGHCPAPGSDFSLAVGGNTDSPKGRLKPTHPDVKLSPPFWGFTASTVPQFFGSRPLFLKPHQYRRRASAPFRARTKSGYYLKFAKDPRILSVGMRRIEYA